MSNAGRTRPDCRVCKHLEATGNHRNGLFKDNLDNYPTHCPRWAEMDFEHRENIIKELGMCLKCLNPRYTLKNKADRLRHERDECSLAKRKRKNKYTCLNEECFLHWWVCTEHRDENRPLFETHAKELIKKRQNIVFAHPCISDPGVKHWHSNTPSKKINIAQPGPDNHTPKLGHNLADILTPIGPQGHSLPDPTQPLTPVPTAHQASRFTDVTNDVIPDDGLELPVMLPRPEDLTTVDVFTMIAAFTRGLLDHWNTHGHLPLAIQNTPFGEDTPAGLSRLAYKSLHKITVFLYIHTLSIH
jgi:hypothetical protein